LSRPEHTVSWAGHTLQFGAKTRIMGIINDRPDSFSDGGKFFDCNGVIAHAGRLVIVAGTTESEKGWFQNNHAGKSDLLVKK